MLKVIFFDAAGTLFEPRDPVGATYARIARGYGVDAGADQVNHAFRRVFGGAPGLAFGPGHSAAELRLLERRWWRELVAASFAGLGTFSSFDDYFDELFAFFADPVVRMGIPGVEYFAHPWMLGPRFAKEALFTGDRFTAQRAYEVGMVNRVVPRAELAETAFAMAERIAAMPPFGLSLAKRAVNQCEDLMGMRSGMDAVFGLHHVAHAHNAETGADSLAGMNARSMKSAANSPAAP